MDEESAAVMREALVLTYEMVNRSLDARGRQMGITRYQSMAMERIRSQPGLPQSDLARWLDTSKQYVSRLVKQMKEQGLVESKTPVSDGRAQRLYLTDLGRQQQDDWRADSVRRVEENLRQLSEEEGERLNEAWHILREILPKLDREDTTLF